MTERFSHPDNRHVGGHTCQHWVLVFLTPVFVTLPKCAQQLLMQRHRAMIISCDRQPHRFRPGRVSGRLRMCMSPAKLCCRAFSSGKILLNFFIKALPYFVFSTTGKTLSIGCIYNVLVRSFIMVSISN